MTANIYRFYTESGGDVRKCKEAAERVYYEKDILRPGAWETQAGTWQVTTETLYRLARNFELAQSRGTRIPVVWNHSRDARDQIGYVTRMFVNDDVLYVNFWAADPEDVKRLGSTVSEVSVEARDNWEDGEGNEYDIIITHLGIVNLPVVPGQDNFKRLSLAGTGNKTKEPMVLPNYVRERIKQLRKSKGRRKRLMAEHGLSVTIADAYTRYKSEKAATETDGKGNPPSWVADEAKWDKAKRAAVEAGADDKYAFTVWFYLNVLDGGKKAKRSSLRLSTGFRRLAKKAVSRKMAKGSWKVSCRPFKGVG